MVEHVSEVLDSSSWPERAIVLFGGREALCHSIAERISSVSEFLDSKNVPLLTAADVKCRAYVNNIDFSELFPAVDIPKEQLDEWIAECEKRGTQVLTPVPEGTDIEKARTLFGLHFLREQALDALCKPSPPRSAEEIAYIAHFRNKYHSLVIS